MSKFLGAIIKSINDWFHMPFPEYWKGIHRWVLLWQFILALYMFWVLPLAPFKAEPEWFQLVYTNWLNQEDELGSEMRDGESRERSQYKSEYTEAMGNWFLHPVGLWDLDQSQNHLSITSWPPVLKVCLMGTWTPPHPCFVHVWMLERYPGLSHCHRVREALEQKMKGTLYKLKQMPSNGTCVNLVKDCT